MVNGELALLVVHGPVISSASKSVPCGQLSWKSEPDFWMLNVTGATTLPTLIFPEAVETDEPVSCVHDAGKFVG